MKIYQADWVVPISSAPIEKGALAVDGSQIMAVGGQTEIKARFPNVQVKDFGEAAILPGLVNAHTHLELTALRGYLDSVEQDFSSWLVKLAAARDRVMTAECLANSTLCGAIEAARAGVTCVGDIAKHGFDSIVALRAVCLRGISYQENSFALDENVADERFAELKEKVARNCEFATDCARVGITPHAPYTVSRKLFELLTDFAIQENLPMTIHAAESKAEQDFMLHGTGNIAEVMKNLGVSWNAPQVSSIKYLNQIGVLAAKPLLAHCINVDERDIEILAETSTKVAHCPKSNAKFAHGIAPFHETLQKNIKVGLGSDSVASNNSCDILEEARFAAFLQRTKGNFVNAEQVLRAATLGGAEALGLEAEAGSLEAGKQADFCVVSLAGLPQQPVYDVYAALVFSANARDVIFTAVAGKPIYEDGAVLTVDEEKARARLKETARLIVQ